MKIKYCGVVVLFNPEDDVLLNIASYQDSLSKIYVVDNSEVKNKGLCEKIKLNSKIEYISFDKNMGLAYALNVGCEKAFLDNYDYILTMDQDSRFEIGAVEKIISLINEDKVHYSIVCPNVSSVYVDKSTNQDKIAYTQLSDGERVERNWVMTSGSMMCLKDYKAAGAFDESLFIAHIDIDMGIKLNKLNCKIIQLGDAILYQRFGNSRPKKILWKTVYPSFASPVRTYYLFRNQKYLENKWVGYKSFINVHLYKFVIKIFLFEDKKFEKIKMAIKGLKHAGSAKMGMYKD